jgi:hypothetical protein
VGVIRAGDLGAQIEAPFYDDDVGSFTGKGIVEFRDAQSSSARNIFLSIIRCRNKDIFASAPVPTKSVGRVRIFWWRD